MIMCRNRFESFRTHLFVVCYLKFIWTRYCKIYTGIHSYYTHIIISLKISLFSWYNWKITHSHITCVGKIVCIMSWQLCKPRHYSTLWEKQYVNIKKKECAFCIYMKWVDWKTFKCWQVNILRYNVKEQIILDISAYCNLTTGSLLTYNMTTDNHIFITHIHVLFTSRFS
jgi:hypothetical protein